MRLTADRHDLGAPGEGSVDLDHNVVGPEYFATLRTPLIAGRDIVVSDVEAAGGRYGVVVNQALVELLWPAEDPLGKEIALPGPEGSKGHVVGVARDGRYRGIREAPRPYVFRPLGEGTPRNLTLIVRTEPGAQGVATAVRGLVRHLDPAIAISEVRTLEQHVAGALIQTRVATFLLAVFGALALLVAGIGLYGVLAYGVARRQREIGVRMALGARREQIARQVLGEGMRLTLVGLGVGVLLSVALTRFVHGLLYGVGPTDPLTYIVVAVTLVIAAVLSSWLPASRAMGVDPMTALRAE
jgi:predicted permease